jgi:transcription elongation factor S-II
MVNPEQVKMQCVVLSAKGTYRCTSISSEGFPTGKEVAAVLRRATDPVHVGTWTWKMHQLHLWGYKTGKAGTENQHTIPPPLEATLYGDAVVVATMSEDGVQQVAPLTTAQYMEFLKQKEDESDEESDFEETESEGSDSAEEDVEEESESDSEMSAILEEEEEEEAPPPPKRTKRVAKKTPQWFSVPPLTAEKESESAQHPIRLQAKLQIQTLLQLSPSEQEELERTILLHSLEDAKKRHVHPVWENKEFTILYDIHLRRVITNMSKVSYISNPRLESRMQEGEFTLGEVASMAFSSLYPEKWKDLFEKEMKREAKMLEVDMSMATDMFRCSKCGKRQCTYYEMQTRSADEPMTIFVRCMNCGKRWRQ